MAKDTSPTNTVPSTLPSTASSTPRWMSRLMANSSPLNRRQSPPAFSVTSITKVHTFGKTKAQSINNSFLGRNDGCDTNNSKPLLRQHHLYDKSSINTKKPLESMVVKLPVELIQDIFVRLDCLALYQLSLTCRAFRHLLLKKPGSKNGFFIWRTFMVDSTLHNQTALNLYQLVAFLVMGRIHSQVDFMILNGCAYLDRPLLDTMVRAFSNLTQLSLVQCPQIDCWQILYMLKSSIKCNHQSTLTQQTDAELLVALKKIRHTRTKPAQLNKTELSTSPVSRATLFDLAATNINDGPSSSLPCLTRLTHLNIQGTFPSERSHKSYGHEMYCFGEIKRALLQLGQNGPSHYQQLSEGHYALYQFWLLLRSHMLRWDDDSTTEFRSPWLPDTLVQFIQITQQDTGLVQLDLTPCPLCHRNVAEKTARPCAQCNSASMMVCAQCKCHSCHAVLCTRCHNADGLLWRVIRCHQCRLPRRTCNQSLCVFKTLKHWTCPTCSQWNKHRPISPRLFKKSRHWSHWI